MHQYCSSENITWDPEKEKEKKINPPVTIKPFKGYNKPYGPTISGLSSVLQLFCLFFTTDLMTTIVAETNRYATLCLKQDQHWEETTIEELQAYFGFLILMGIVRLPSIRDYWRTDEFYNYRPIAQRISRTRFLQIHSFLHFVNNDLLPPYGHSDYSKIQKVKPVMKYLSAKCLELFTPGQDLAVDEAMVKYKGRSSIKQDMPKKPIKRGFNIWMIADSDSGYVTKFQVYEGKTSTGKTEKGLSKKVVLTLSQEISHKYHHVYFDNFFTGIDLMLDLLRLGTYSCGTFRSDRKGFPEALKSVVKKGLPNRGDCKTARYGNMAAVTWQDTKPITCASTNIDPELMTLAKRKKKDGATMTIPCPQSIAQYNQKMGGVDRNDQLRGYYGIKIKSHKFYKYLFFGSLDIAITNCYVLSRFLPDLKTKSLKDFRMALAKELIGEYNSRKRKGRRVANTPTKRFCPSHFPTKADHRRNKCHYCACYLHKRGETAWECTDCNVYLCHTGSSDDCFCIYHTKHIHN